MRRHTDRACDRCRRRKIKCDGQSPACGRCQGSDLACDYTLPRAKRGPKFRSETRTASLATDAVATTSMSPGASMTCSLAGSGGSPGERWSHEQPGSSPWGASTSSPSRPGRMLRAQATTCHRRSPAQETHASLIAEVAETGLPLPEIAERCLDLSVQWGFPITISYDASALRRGIDLLMPASAPLFAPSPHAREQDAYGRDPAQLENLRCFTLLTAVCAKICAQAPLDVLDHGSALVRPFLTASRQMLATFEDHDVMRPDSRSLVIRAAQSATLHCLGQKRLSRYVLGQAFRLIVDMRLSDKASYDNLDAREAQMRKNSCWILYTSDKSASTLNGTATMLHESPPGNEAENAAGIEDTEGNVMLLRGFNPRFYPEAFERQLLKGIAMARRVWVLGSDICRDMNLLFHATAELGEISESSRTADAFQKKIMNSYLTFCSLPDYLPPWLVWPESYSDPEADEAVLAVRRSMLWSQKADLVVTHYCLRLSLTLQAFEQGCPSLLGLTSNQDMLDLRITELAQDLLAAMKDLPYTTLYISGESLVSHLVNGAAVTDL